MGREDGKRPPLTAGATLSTDDPQEPYAKPTRAERPNSARFQGVRPAHAPAASLCTSRRIPRGNEGEGPIYGSFGAPEDRESGRSALPPTRKHQRPHLMLKLSRGAEGGGRTQRKRTYAQVGRPGRPSCRPSWLQRPGSRETKSQAPGRNAERGLSQPPQEVGAGDEADAARLPSGALLP